MLNDSLHEDSNNNNGVRVINCATSINLLTSSMMLPYQNIHKYSRWEDWQSDWSCVDRQEIPLKYTWCTIFQWSWLWFWSLSDCTIRDREASKQHRSWVWRDEVSRS